MFFVGAPDRPLSLLAPVSGHHRRQQRLAQRHYDQKGRRPYLAQPPAWALPSALYCIDLIYSSKSPSSTSSYVISLIFLAFFAFKKICTQAQSHALPWKRGGSAGIRAGRCRRTTHALSQVTGHHAPRHSGHSPTRIFSSAWQVGFARREHRND